jgi:hypothetical protein
MKVKLLTTILLILCGIGIGWLAYENLMWAVWGKQNRWFEYVGFWGCPILVVSGLFALKNLRLGSLLGCVGFILTMFYLWSSPRQHFLCTDSWKAGVESSTDRRVGANNRTAADCYRETDL